MPMNSRRWSRDEEEGWPGGWDGLELWSGSGESGGLTRANLQNGPMHEISPFLSPGPVQPVQSIGSGRVLKPCFLLPWNPRA
ncbi:hypothetical protein SLEP1_g55612 [Rubroshorea leprosula]|uniref:Uncharacterized protein n=1 Tax=Rubroshorea leprosula TaxID=152421 RepID=A0AAV5MJ42_9ROSI|nr:hypothetical protein SLEP1_g55612 [Rubroshorea leprosula]